MGQKSAQARAAYFRDYVKNRDSEPKETENQQYLLAIAEERSMRLKAYYAERERERRREYIRALCEQRSREIAELCTKPFSWQESR